MAQTFTHSEMPDDGKFQDYVKRGTEDVTRAMRVDGDFYAVTPQGTVYCPDGWLTVDPNGNPLPVSAEEFEANYESRSSEDSGE